MRIAKSFPLLLAAAITASAVAETAPAPSEKRAAVQRNMLAGLREAIELKRSLTPEERKLDAQLLLDLRARGGAAVTSGHAKRSEAQPETAKAFSVYKIEAAPTPQLIADIETLGGRVLAQLPKRELIAARLPQDALLPLARRADVKHIGVAAKAIPQQVSEGGTAHGVNVLNPALTGAGVVIGVISEQVDPVALKTSVDDLELPAAQLYAIDWTAALPADRESQSAIWNAGTTGAWADNAAGTTDGIAMLQVVNDIAPDATLLFTSYNDAGVAGMASAIDALANPPAGAEYLAADIIVDDLFFFEESPFQDDIVAQAAMAAVAGDVGVDPVTYVSSAGDFGNVANGTASVYEADFTGVAPENTCAPEDTVCNQNYEDIFGTDGIFGAGGYEVHEFTGGASVAISENLSELCLFWAEPLNGATSDYDLFVFDSNGELVDFGDNFFDNSSTEPKECVSTDASLVAGNVVMVASVLSGSDDRFFHLGALPLALEQSGAAPQSAALAETTSGAIRGQAGAEGVLAIGAANYQDPAGTPRLFASDDSVAAYSADGYRRVFFEANGDPITADDFLSTGGEERIKPDLVAADGVPLTLPGAVSAPAFGTSISAAHAAGLAALLLEAKTDATPAELAEALLRTAIDFDPVGVDLLAGYGAADVFAAEAAIVTPMPVRNLTLTAATAEVQLNFERPFDDYNSDFTFSGVCTGTPPGGVEETFLNGPVDFASLPLTIDVFPGTPVSCSVLATDGVNGDGPATTSGPVTAGTYAAAANVSLTALSAGASFSFATSPDDPGDFTYLLECVEKTATDDPAPVTLLSETRVPGTHIIEATPGNYVDCTVTPQTTINATPVDGTPATVANVQVNDVAATTLTLTADAGGFSAGYTLDPNIASTDMLTVLMTCTADGAAVSGLTDVDLTAGNNPAFFDADPDQALSCTATTTLTVNGTEAVSAVQPAASVATVTPEEPVSGLPIWLLYQATQQSQPAEPPP